jgi:hypothetical protein
MPYFCDINLKKEKRAKAAADKLPGASSTLDNIVKQGCACRRMQGIGEYEEHKKCHADVYMPHIRKDLEIWTSAEVHRDCRRRLPCMPRVCSACSVGPT